MECPSRDLCAPPISKVDGELRVGYTGKPEIEYFSAQAFDFRFYLPCH
jgi:hypothetical protein